MKLFSELKTFINEVIFQENTNEFSKKNKQTNESLSIFNSIFKDYVR